jgi:Asp-tRNA(Asn)/Glu-tRNA(Gln) amidotransferase A subunit family amidase
LFSPALDHAEDGPLAGVPFLIKDSGPMAEGVPFSLGSRAIRGAVARHDTDLMTRLRAAGLVTLGLTTVPELVISFSTEPVKHGLSALELMAGLDAQNLLSRSVGRFFTEYDLLVTPTLGRLPAPHGTLRYDDPDHTLDSWLRSLFEYGPFTALFNITGQPAISLPLGQSRTGLPIGVQLVAPYGREDLLFQIAGRLEDAAPWHHRTPGVFAGGH